MKPGKLFLKLSRIIIALILFELVACNTVQKKEKTMETKVEQSETFFKLSLAQWSLHNAIKYEKTLDPIDFAQKAKELGFEGLEYVSDLYIPNLAEGDDPQKAMQNLLDTLKIKSEIYGMKNVLIMIDGEGDLATPNEEERNQAFENHKKWVDAAAFLGCHSIRVNVSGSNDVAIWTVAAVSGLKQLSEYAKQKNINIIVENHGGLSSNAEFLSQVITNVGMDNCGTLPDFGNFCIRSETAEDGESKCVEEYDAYKGMEILMKQAKAVSAKSYDFDDSGKETTLDYERILKTVKKAGYTGFIGVEYEGDRLSEDEGIIATRDLLINLGKQLN